MSSVKKSVFYLNFLVQFVISTFDVNYPIILSSNSNGYFGYTVALSYSPSMRNSEYGWIFIGSPNDTNPILKCRLSTGNEHCTSLYKDASFITQFGITLSTRPSDNNIVTCSHFKYGKKSTLDADMDGSCLGIQENNNLFEIVKSGKLPSKTNDYNANWAPQIGISSFIRNEKVIIGVPGIDYLRGSVLIYDNLFGGSPAHSFVKIISNELHFDQLGSLFGYGVTAGKYFGNGILYYAVGTPKAHGLTGNVVVFRLNGNGNPLDSSEIKDELPNIGSYYGSVVFSYSIWKNSKDELFISAPFHNTIASSSKENSGELHKGRVYIYTVLENKFQLWQTLEPDNYGEECYFARFGSAITGLGDINGDKINDFAVGAPGENNGRGAVYVYYGSSARELHKELKYIKIKASFIDNRLNGFGSNLFGDIDFDGNVTPDLAIGAFPSRQIVILRTRPLIDLDLKLLIISNNKVVQTISRNERHFFVQVCVKYQTRYPIISQKLKVYWILKIDDYQKDKTCTIVDARTPIKIPRKMDHIIEVQDEYSIEDKCKKIRVNIKLDDELTKFDDIIFDLYAQYIPKMYENFNSSSNASKSMRPRNIVIDLNQSSRSGLYQINEEKSKNQAKIEDFCPECPNATEKYLTTRLIINPEDCKNDKCNPQFSIKTRWISNNQEISQKFSLELVESAGENDLMMEVLIKNSGESAINPVLNLKVNILGIQMSLYNLTRYNCSAKYIDDNNDNDGLECDLGKFLRNGQMIGLLFKLDFTEYFASDLTEVLIISTTTKQRYDERIVHHESQIQLQNKPTFPKIIGINETRNINLKMITHSYKISLSGQRSVRNLLLIFLLPQFIRINDEYVEYFKVKELEPDCSVIAEVNKTIIEVKKSSISMYNNDSVIHLGCSSIRSKITCIQIQCVKKNIRFIRDDDFIEISFTVDVLQELDNILDLFEIDSSKRDIAYESQGFVKVFGENGTNSSITLLQERIPSISSTLLIISSLGGLFLLALFILAFYKIGKDQNELQNGQIDDENST